MERFKKIFRKEQALIISFLVASFLFISTKKVFDYASPPSSEKRCDFIFPALPHQTEDISAPRNITVAILDLAQKGGTINDASCLNQTSIYGVARITDIEDIQKALFFAQENNLKITSSGQRHSMGGQSFSKNGLVLDMRNFNQIRLDKEKKILNAQSGATWAEIQQFLDKEGLAVKAMQSINIFTVGGTLSVNAHGIAHNPGPIASTIKSMRIMMSDGEIKTASPFENSELFKLAIGGYGLFGVILDADIEVVDNEMYEWRTNYVDYKDFPEFYKKNIEGDEKIGLTYARLSISPTSYLTETAVHTYVKTGYEGQIPNLQSDEHDWLSRLVINFSKTGSFGRWTRWIVEKHAAPVLHACLSRNQIMSQKEVCLVSRNQEMYDAMGYLKNRLQDTDILQEYFVPHE